MESYVLLEVVLIEIVRKVKHYVQVVDVSLILVYHQVVKVDYVYSKIV